MTKIKYPIVCLRSVSKKYFLGKQEAKSGNTGFEKHNIWALKKINLMINRGEQVGVIGTNGSGKTTLLEIAAGITEPTSGSVNWQGRIISLIQLDAGFHPELTGRENILLNSMFFGFDQKSVKQQLPSIIRFSGIGDFVDFPLYTFSDGMKLRLGFSMAIHSNPDLMVLDEAFSFGDRIFRRLAIDELKKKVGQGMGILYASHNLQLLAKRCDRLIWLDKGRIKGEGLPGDVIKKYFQFTSAKQGKNKNPLY